MKKGSLIIQNKSGVLLAKAKINAVWKEQRAPFVEINPFKWSDSPYLYPHSKSCCVSGWALSSRPHAGQSVPAIFHSYLHVQMTSGREVLLTGKRREGRCLGESCGVVQSCMCKSRRPVVISSNIWTLTKDEVNPIEEKCPGPHAWDSQERSVCRHS